MTDTIIGRLSGIEGLKVISMTSVMRYKTPDRILKKIGQDLTKLGKPSLFHYKLDLIAAITPKNTR